MQTYEGSIKEEDKERDKLFILGMITHESDKKVRQHEDLWYGDSQ